MNNLRKAPSNTLITIVTWALGILSLIGLWTMVGAMLNEGDPFPEQVEVNFDFSEPRSLHQMGIPGGKIYWITNPQYDTVEKIEMWTVIADEW